MRKRRLRAFTLHYSPVYINIVMMVTLRSKATFGETARYIVFGHMLLNDTLHLGVGLVLYVLGAFYITLVRRCRPQPSPSRRSTWPSVLPPAQLLAGHTAPHAPCILGHWLCHVLFDVCVLFLA